MTSLIDPHAPLRSGWLHRQLRRLPRPDWLQMNPRFVRFLIAGSANTGVTYVLYLVLCLWTPMEVAYTVTYALGIILAYVLNAKFVFGTPMSLASALRYPAVYVVQYLYGLVAMWILLGLRIPNAPAMAAVIITSLPLTFVLNRTVLRPTTS